MAGILKKKSRHGFWQKRYFQLANNYMNYYTDAKKTRLLASLPLSEVVNAELLDITEGVFTVICLGNDEKTCVVAERRAAPATLRSSRC